MSVSERYVIDKWTVDPALNQISSGDRVISLEPRLIDLLDFLSGHPNVTHSRETLEQTVWGGARVSDGTINHAIAQVRKALDDDPKQPKFIQTIPKKGYRFLATRRSPERGGAAKPVPQRISKSSSALVVVAVLSVLGYLGWRARGTGPHTSQRHRNREQ